MPGPSQPCPLATLGGLIASVEAAARRPCARGSLRALLWEGAAPATAKIIPVTTAKGRAFSKRIARLAGLLVSMKDICELSLSWDARDTESFSAASVA